MKGKSLQGRSIIQPSATRLGSEVPVSTAKQTNKRNGDPRVQMKRVCQHKTTLKVSSLTAAAEDNKFREIIISSFSNRHVDSQESGRKKNENKKHNWS